MGYLLFLLIWPICAIAHPDGVQPIKYSRYFCSSLHQYRQPPQLTLIYLAGLFRSYLFLNISWPGAIQLCSHQSDASTLLLPSVPLNPYLQLCGIFSWEGSNWGGQVFLSFFLSQCPVQQALPLTAAAGCPRLSYKLCLRFLLWTEGEVRGDALLSAPSMSGWEHYSVDPTCGDELPGLLPEHLQKYLYRLFHLKRSVLPSHMNLGSNKSNLS